jgi:nucleoside triphosphatase
MSEQIFPEPTVGALIFNPSGKLFLMRSYKWHGAYVIPGGHIELGETAVEALRREIKEETALDIYAIEFLCVQEFINDKAFWKKRHFIFLDYACRTDSTDVVLNSEGHDHVWVTLDEAQDMEIDSYTRKAITKYLEKHRENGI